MDIILDANAYIRVLHNHGRGFLQTNQFAELLTYLRRTGSRLVIPELTCNEVVARYGERLVEVTKDARDAWSTLQQVGMQERMDFLEPNTKSELATLHDLLLNPAQGVRTVLYTDYSGVDVRQVVRRGVGRVRPANDKGEELRDVILWLIVLHYAKESKTRIAFVSDDKTFQRTDGTLHPTLQQDVEQAAVDISFYRSVGDLIKANALESELLAQENLVPYVSAEEPRGIATEQLLGSQFWYGTIVGAEVLRCELAEARRYRVAEDSYYVEARYTGEGIIRMVPLTTAQAVTLAATRPTPNVDRFFEGPFGVFPQYSELSNISPGVAYNTIIGVPVVAEATAKRYGCSFSLRLSMRIAGSVRESLEVDEFVLLGELTPITASAS